MTWSDTPSVVLVTANGETRTFEGKLGQSVVEIAEAGGTLIASLCRRGSCGTCVGRVRSGTYDSRPFSPDALGAGTPEGMVLLCCTEPTTDMEVALDYTADRLASGAPPERTATISALDELTPGVFRLRLQLVPDDRYGSGAEFSAGQFCQLEAPGTEVLRAYSMANVSNWDGELEFLIHVVAGGVFTGWLSERARVGDELTVVGPQGTFGLVENGMRPRWFIGGGCGFAPLLSMLRRMAEWGDPQPVRLYFGVNTTEAQFADGDITELLAVLPQLDVTSCVWTPDGGLEPTPDARWCRRAGTPVDAFVTDVLSAPETPDVYVCGPPAMVAALEARLDAHGIDPARVHAERIS